MIAVVALVVAGPKDLPKMLRKAGRMAAKLRRMAADLRAQSGIDDALRTEGLSEELAELRKLARGEIDRVDRAVRYEPAAAAPETSAQDLRNRDWVIARDREYPRDGADSYGALPDDAVVYADTLPASPWARDALYVMGDASAELPPEPVAEDTSAEDTSAEEAEPAGAEEAEPASAGEAEPAGAAEKARIATDASSAATDAGTEPPPSGPRLEPTAAEEAEHAGAATASVETKAGGVSSGVGS